MILEERIYTFKPGTLPEFLAMYEKEGFETHTKYLGKPLGYFTTDIGPLNQLVHMWGYESHVDRNERRAKLYADPHWQAFVPKTAKFIDRMENKILVPTSFSPPTAASAP